MSAAEIIELFKQLPPAERAQVREYVRHEEAAPKEIVFASDEAVDRSMTKVFAENKELLRRLAQ